jgi:hypothetical protein
MIQNNFSPEVFCQPSLPNIWMKIFDDQREPFNPSCEVWFGETPFNVAIRNSISANCSAS